MQMHNLLYLARIAVSFLCLHRHVAKPWCRGLCHPMGHLVEQLHLTGAKSSIRSQ